MAKQLEQNLGKQYEPIEPESFLQRINPYKGSFEYMIKNPKKIRTFFEFAALVIFPGGKSYFEKNFDNLMKDDPISANRVLSELRENIFSKINKPLK